jgi:arsenite methyltransferase
MEDSKDKLKELVKEKYGQIACQTKGENQKTCCGAGSCSLTTSNIMTDDYSGLNGYNPDADLGLGCGIPTEFAKIKKRDTVVDLGSGAGNDCFVARSITGEEGTVIGIDMTEAMIQRARQNAEKLGYKNVEFHLGDIEDIPLPPERTDVVISNCVMNLVPNKEKAFAEVFRILKPGGHFSISDVVLKGELPESLRKEAELYVGCVAGAIQKEDYLNIISKAGFQNITIQREKQITVPDDILLNYISQEELKALQESENGIFSITVYAEKSKPSSCSSCCKSKEVCC